MARTLLKTGNGLGQSAAESTIPKRPHLGKPDQGLAPDAAGASLSTAALAWKDLIPSASPVDRSVDGAQVMYRRASHWFVNDITTATSFQVDVYADGSPRPESPWQGALSGDGNTAVAMYAPEQGHDFPRIQVVRPGDGPGGGTNWSFELPDPGEQRWSSGSIEQCFYGSIGTLHVNQDGTRAWFTTNPCYWPHIFILDITDPVSPSWNWVQASTQGRIELSQDGSTIGVSWTYCHTSDEGCPWGSAQFYSEMRQFPPSFSRAETAVPVGYYLDWPPYSQSFTDLGPNGFGTQNGDGSLIAWSTPEAGLDRENVIHIGGPRYLYLFDTVAHSFFNLTNTSSEDLSQLRLSQRGDRVAHTKLDGQTITLEMRSLGSGPTIQTADITSPWLLDPTLRLAHRGSTSYDPTTGQPTGSNLQVSELLPAGEFTGYEYVALGDSYSAGEGVPPFLSGSNSGGNQCHRSTSAYSQLFAGEPGTPDFPDNGIFRACSGAVTANVFGTNSLADIAAGRTGSITQWGERPQILDLWKRRVVGSSTKVVTLTMTGNDLGFADVVKTCLVDPTQIACLGLTNYLSAAKTSETLARISAILDRLHKEAPNATIYLLTYPRFFPLLPTGTCNAKPLISGWSRLEQISMNLKLIEYIDKLRTTVANKSFVRFVDVYDALRGHEVCTADPWMNQFDFGQPSEYSYHPNAEGQASMERILYQAWQASNAGWLDLQGSTSTIAHSDTSEPGTFVATVRARPAATARPSLGARLAAVANVEVTVESPSGMVFDTLEAPAGTQVTRSDDGVTVAIATNETGHWKVDAIAPEGVEVWAETSLIPVPNEPPVATLALTSDVGRAPLTVDASVTMEDSDGPNAPASVRWAVDGIDVTGSGTSLSLPLDEVGEHVIKVLVADAEGSVGLATRLVQVKKPLGVSDPAGYVYVDARSGGGMVYVGEPNDDGGAAIIDYEITVEPGGTVYHSTSPIFRISGLDAGTVYTASVRLINSYGPSDAKVSEPFTPSPPQVPSGLSGWVYATNTSVAAVGYINDDGGRPIDKLAVTTVPDSGEHLLPLDAAEAELTGLTSGETYEFFLQASNSVGDSTKVSLGSATVPTTLETCSTCRVDITVPALNTPASRRPEVSLQWTASGFPPGVDLSSFTVQRRRITVDDEGVRSVSSALSKTYSADARGDVFRAKPGAVYQFRAQAVDQRGTDSTWSSWKTSTVVADDRSLRVGRKWKLVKDSTAYQSTLTLTTKRSAKLTATAWANHISVVGRRSSASGVFKLYVDGRLIRRVNAYSPKTLDRQTLAQVQVPYGKHTVSLVNVGKGNRRELALDGLGFRL